MSSDNVLLETGVMLVAHLGMLIGTVCLPVAASFILDGIVQLLRGDGPKVFLGALALAVGFAGGGYLLWRFGIGNEAMDAGSQSLMVTVAPYLLALSGALALVGFVVRTRTLLRNARREEDRLQYLHLTPQYSTGSALGEVPGEGRQTHSDAGDALPVKDAWSTYP